VTDFSGPPEWPSYGSGGGRHRKKFFTAFDSFSSASTATRNAKPVMLNQLSAPLGASISVWMRDIQNELATYTGQMTTYHWGVVAGCAVAFGFLCLKGSGVNR